MCILENKGGYAIYNYQVYVLINLVSYLRNCSFKQFTNNFLEGGLGEVDLTMFVNISFHNFMWTPEFRFFFLNYILLPKFWEFWRIFLNLKCLQFHIQPFKIMFVPASDFPSELLTWICPTCNFQSKKLKKWCGSFLIHTNLFTLSK